MESLTGVMRVKPFKATAHHNNQSPVEKQQPKIEVQESNNKPNSRSLIKMDPNNEVFFIMMILDQRPKQNFLTMLWF